jgi:hypothetical protein
MAVGLCCGWLVDASAQTTTAAPVGAPTEVDAGDLWRAIRHRGEPPPDAPLDERRRMFVVAPVIGSNPSTGVTIGAAGQVAFFRGPHETTSISSGVASLVFSTEGQALFTVRSGIFTSANRWFIEGDNRLHDTSQDTYALGGASAASTAVGASYTFVRLHDTVYRAIAHGLYAGIGWLFDSHADVNPHHDDDSAWPTSAYVAYTTEHGLPIDGQQSAGLGISLLADRRDSQINARHGWLAAVSFKQFFDGFAGGDSQWQAVHLEGRGYVPLREQGRHRLAVWMYADLVTSGTAPYFDLPTTAMDVYGRSARGYREGRFRGDQLAYGEVEYRGPVMRNGFLGLVLFANVTSVAQTDRDQHLFDDVAPAFGGGLRVLINKRSRTNLCVDAAWGKDGSRGVYLAIQEVF